MNNRMLSICIPTHHGRRQYLRELLESITRQLDDDLLELVSICISDNGSQDDTIGMIDEFQRNSPVTLSYFRFEKNEGLLNFENVIAMADGTYCWMVGSDDIIPPGSIRTILKTITSFQDISGFTFNKLNFNVDYSALIGRDHEIALPKNWKKERVFLRFDETIAEMWFLFQFISAHAFKKQEWNSAFESFGRAGFNKMRHFAFLAVLVRIIKNSRKWLWHPEFLITQRLGNSCLVEEFGEIEFAFQCTEDMASIIDLMVSQEKEIKHIRAILYRKLFVLYWNPLLILKYKSDKSANFTSDLKMLKFCVTKFSRIWIFWFTTFPILLLPCFFGKPLRSSGFKILYLLRREKLNSTRLFLRGAFIKFLIALKIQSRAENELDPSIEECSSQTLDFVRNLDTRAV